MSDNFDFHSYTRGMLERQRKAEAWDRLAPAALKVIESAYTTPEWMQHARTLETDVLLGELRSAIAATAASDVFRTPNPDCPACQALRIHTVEEWHQYHPLAGSRGPGAS